MATNIETRRRTNASELERFRSMRDSYPSPQELSDMTEIAVCEIVFALTGIGVMVDPAIEMVDKATKGANSPNQVSCAIRNRLPPSLF